MSTDSVCAPCGSLKIANSRWTWFCSEGVSLPPLFSRRKNRARRWLIVVFVVVKNYGIKLMMLFTGIVVCDGYKENH